MCLLYSIHKTSNLRNCIHEVTSHLGACDHYCWHQRYIFAISMPYGWNRLGAWCTRFLEHIRYMNYGLEWYLKHCGSHNDMFLICLGSLLSFQRVSHAFICLNHSSHLPSALDKSVEIGMVRGQCRPELYAIALVISPSSTSNIFITEWRKMCSRQCLIPYGE